MKTFMLMLAAMVLGAAAGSCVALLQDTHPGPQYERLLRVSVTADHIATVAAESPENEGGRLVVEGGEQFEFGVMDRGETRSHSFKFINNTDRAVRLRVGSTTCKCTVGELDSDTLKAGGFGEVTLEWIAKSYEPKFQQSATIETTDPTRPKIVLSVTGQVLQLVQPLPQAVAVGDVSYGTDRTDVVRIYSFQDSALSIVGHEFDDPTTAKFFEFEWRNLDLDEDQKTPEGATAAVECSLRTLPGLPYGKVAQSIRITTDAVRSAVVELPIVGRVVSDLVLAGPGYVEEADILKLGVIKQGVGAERKLRLIVRRADVNDVQVRVGRVEPADALEVEIGQPESLKGGTVLMFPLTVRVRPDAEPVNFMGAKDRAKSKIVLETTHPVVPQMQIDVRFSIL